MMTKAKDEVRAERRRTRAGQLPTLWVACLWPKNGLNLGTLVRTCDAVGAGLVVTHGESATKALRQGDTIGLHNVWLSYVRDPLTYLAGFRGHRAAIELATDSRPIAGLALVDEPTVLVLGHENYGIPDEAWQHIDAAYEIPMVGVGNSLNVAVAGSLALYAASGLLTTEVSA